MDLVFGLELSIVLAPTVRVSHHSGIDGFFPSQMENGGKEVGTILMVSGPIITAKWSSLVRNNLAPGKLFGDTGLGILRHLIGHSGIDSEMIALVEITDGSSPLMISKNTGFGGVGVYDTKVSALSHAEPENTKPDGWILFDEQGTFFTIAVEGKWFELKPIKNDPLLAMNILMKTLRGA